MKILSIRKGFVTNSSSANYWFFVVEKTKDAKEEIAERVAQRCDVSKEEALSSVRSCLRKPRDKSVYGVYSQKEIFTIETPEVEEMYEDLLEEVDSLSEAVLEERIESLKKDTGVETPNSERPESIRLADGLAAMEYDDDEDDDDEEDEEYEEEWDEDYDMEDEEEEANLGELVLLLAVFKTAERFAKSKKGKLHHLYILTPTGEYAFEIADAWESGSGLDFYDEAPPGTAVLNGKFVAEKGGFEGIETYPAIDLKSGESYAIHSAVTEDYYPLTTADLLEVLDSVGWLDEFITFVEKNAAKGDPEARIARVVLHKDEGEA